MPQTEKPNRKLTLAKETVRVLNAPVTGASSATHNQSCGTQSHPTSVPVSAPTTSGVTCACAGQMR